MWLSYYVIFYLFETTYIIEYYSLSDIICGDRKGYEYHHEQMVVGPGEVGCIRKINFLEHIFSEEKI